MNSVIASIGRNVVLLGIVTLTILNYLLNLLNWQELLAIQGVLGLVYVFLSCYEYLNASYKASLPLQRFPYFTNYYFMIRAMKISLFLSFSILLYFSDSVVRYMFPVCLLIAGTEIIITLLKYQKALCFVNIYANYLLIAQSSFSKIFASEIMIVEFRHEIFYFVKKNRKTVTIRLEHIQARESFIKALHVWIKRNNVLLSDESRVKIEERIASWI